MTSAVKPLPSTSYACHSFTKSATSAQESQQYQNTFPPSKESINYQLNIPASREGHYNSSVYNETNLLKGSSAVPKEPYHNMAGTSTFKKSLPFQHGITAPKELQNFPRNLNTCIKSYQESSFNQAATVHWPIQEHIQNIPSDYSSKIARGN